ncbi:MAG: hypothetical protein QXZ13_03740 [Candidatus Diapherotrites archaeon]
MPKTFPESELIRRSFTIRQLDFPPEVVLTKRSLVRWFAISCGLISENESRSSILKVLDAIFYFQVSKKKFPKISELITYLNSQKEPMKEKTLRYHLNVLLSLGLLEWHGKCVRFTIDPLSDQADLAKGFEYSISKNISDCLLRISFCLQEIRKKYTSD